jgi:hypothetical protein
VPPFAPGMILVENELARQFASERC